MDSQTNALFDSQTIVPPKYGLNEITFNAAHSPKPQRSLQKSPSAKKFVVLSEKKDERPFLTPSSSFAKNLSLRTGDPSLTFSSPNMLKSNPNLQHLVRSGSYVFNESGTGKLFSDATSIRSLVSIGMGSTDGRKMVIRKVPNSPTELLNYINPPTPPEDIYENESFDFSNDDDGDGIKPRRQYWQNKMHFVLACIGYSVGLSNVFRFPYIMFKSGGGIFLIPYIIILLLCGIPVLFLELAVGQFTGRGPIKTIGQLCPLLKGSGVASVIVSFFMSTYYSVVIGYSIFYFFTSFRTHLPWMECSLRWNTPDCWNMEIMMKTNASTRPVNPQTPSEEFFQNKVLQMSEGLEYPGGMRWDLVACLVCAWILVYFAIWKSIKSSTKIRYFTASFPYILIVVCLGRALTLEGADKGLQFFFRPDWSKLKESNVWINAASQSFNSLGIAFGAMISFASFNKYNNNVLHDALAVSSVNIITSMLVGLMSFATIGNIAYEKGLSIEKIIEDGPGLIFIVYPQVLARMPSPQLWSVLFFFMLLCLGLNSQFAIVEVVVTSIQDGFPNWIKTKLVYHELLVLIVCIFAFFFGLPYIFQAGIFYFQLIDHYVATITILFVAFFQIIAVSWFYGIDRLSKNIRDMTGKDPSLYFRFCWLVTAPLVLVGIFILALVNYKPLTYQNENYLYPVWAHLLGWLIVGATLSCIPAFAFFNLYHAEGKNIRTRYKHSMKPNIYECSVCHEHNCDHIEEQDEDFHLFPITLQPPPLINKKQSQNGIAENKENLDNGDIERQPSSSKTQDIKN